MAAQAGKESWVQSDSETEKFSVLFQEVVNSLKSKHCICKREVSLYGNVLSEIYGKLRPWEKGDSRGINYDDIKTCCGYLRNYALCHAVLARSVCFKVMEKCESKFKEILDRKQLHILSIGGGPGNDLLGFCSALYSHLSAVETLELTVLDRCSGWDTVFKDVVDTAKKGSYGDVSKLFRRSLITTRFEVYDLLSDGESEAMKTADILIMSKVLSEQHEEMKYIILKKIFDSMKTDALFVYMDTGSKIIRKEFSAKFVNGGFLEKLLYIPGKNVVSVPRSLTSGIPKCTFQLFVLQKVSVIALALDLQTAESMGIYKHDGISRMDVRDGAETAEYDFEHYGEGDTIDGAFAQGSRPDHEDIDEFEDENDDDDDDSDDDDVDEEDDSYVQDEVCDCQCAVEHKIADYSCIFKTKA